jgi:tetratricopeptide (TPR) repeat protein
VTERETLEDQTRRNLEGMDLERSGQIERAVELYERNVAEGFEGDWPYGRLVAYYEKEGRLDEAERILQRAIDVFKASKRRTPEDRRATLAAFRGRLRVVKKARKQR